jgi:hypothetical protein
LQASGFLECHEGEGRVFVTERGGIALRLPQEHLQHSYESLRVMRHSLDYDSCKRLSGWLYGFEYLIHTPCFLCVLV